MDPILIDSPVTGARLAEVHELPPDDVASAVETARAALPALMALTIWERADLLQRTADELASRRTQALEEHLDEHGKTRAEAEAEFEAALGGIRATAESARRMDGRITGVADRNKKVLIERRPLGVVGAITPWNVPFMVPFEYIAPALAMGNPVVWKPAESVPATSRHIQAAIDAAGWPAGAVQALFGGPLTGATLARQEGLDVLCFTGSSEVGEELSRLGGRRKLILELGGNGPSVVFADSDLEAAAGRIVRGACALSGQSCAATELVLVERSAQAQLLEALVERARQEQVGDPRDPSSTLGPIHLRETGRKIARHVADAVDRGGTVLQGGSFLSDAPTEQYWQPTVIADVDPSMAVFAEETFGPVVPVSGFEREEQIRELAGAGGYGLSSAVFTTDITRAFRIADALPAPYVVVNDTSNYWEMHLPWGGAPGTRSGVGRLGGDHALFELSTTKTVAVDIGM
jgi:succinate-semialdehyde dehydrogenase/glutarate-semialdehyde dehydrogenase